MPHELDQDRLGQGEIRLQMRVKGPVETPVWVEVRSGDNLVTRSGEPYARPGEMVTLTLGPKQYNEVDRASQLTVAVVKR